MKRWLALSTAALVLSLAAGAAAQQPAAVTDPPKPAERRSGLVVGASGGVQLGTASGYPNEAAKIGDAAYYGAGGAMVGYGGTFFVMGAFADVFNFGVWFGTGILGNSDWRSPGMGGGFRAEAFPFYGACKCLRDLGLMAQFGIGGGSLDATHGYYPGASGVQSYASAGVFYEWNFLQLNHGHFALAPGVDYNYIGSRGFDRSVVVFGGRIAFYSGP